MKLFLLVICLLISGSVAIDFTTIGQKEIVDYIKNRADLLHGIKLSGRNLQDLLSNAVFTGLEEEALTFAYGSSVDSGSNDDDQLAGNLAVLAAKSDSTESTPLKIFLTSDTLGTTDIALGELTTTKSSSSKSSVGDFIVNCVQQKSFDSTSLDGSITINLGGATNSHNLTLSKTIYLAAEVNVTSLGSNWESSSSSSSSSSLLTDEGKLLSMLNSKEGSMYIVTYQSLIRETIQAKEGDLFGGLKSSGKVLVVIDSQGMVSLSGRTISGKIEATWENEAEEHVDNFLTLNGSKSRKFMISDMMKSKSSNFISFGGFPRRSSSDSYSSHRGNRRGSSRSSHGSKTKDSYRSGWKPSCSDGSTWPSWRSYSEYGYNYRYGWRSWDLWDQLKNWGFDDEDEDWTSHRHPSKPSTTTTTTPKPVKTTKKPRVTPSTTTTTTTTTTPKPIETVKPVVTVKPTPEVEVTTIKMTSQPPIQESTTPTIKTPEIKPDLSEPTFTDLPKGTTISLWTTRLI